jgi:hypothetical protein
VGGQYAYLRDAWGPMPAFLYGWSLLLVIQSGGMAAVAITFAFYFHQLTGLAVPDGAIAAIVLILLTAINCWGVKAGSNVQSLLMVLKILAIVMLVACGLLLAGPHPGTAEAGAAGAPPGLIAGIGAASKTALNRFDRMQEGPHEREEGGIYYASLRGGSVAGDHLVIFAGDGERIELGHRAESRAIFAKGAVEAALWLHSQKPGRYTMQDVLGLA